VPEAQRRAGEEARVGTGAGLSRGSAARRSRDVKAVQALPGVLHAVPGP
jgi:hypothetical protein